MLSAASTVFSESAIGIASNLLKYMCHDRLMSWKDLPTIIKSSGRSCPVIIKDLILKSDNTLILIPITVNPGAAQT